MGRLWSSLITIIIVALAVRIVWMAIAPVVPYAVGGLAMLGGLSLVLARRRRW